MIALRLVVTSIAFWACLASASLAQEFSRAQLDFYEAKIRPALIKHCYKCHSHKAGTSEGGLYLDTRGGFLRAAIRDRLSNRVSQTKVS